jgi:hypothetical protein
MRRSFRCISVAAAMDGLPRCPGNFKLRRELPAEWVLTGPAGTALCAARMLAAGALALQEM